MGSVANPQASIWANFCMLWVIMLLYLPQAYSALLHAAVKCGEVELAIDVYRQMGAEGMAREKMDFQTMVDVFVKMGRHIEALGVLDDMRKAGQPAEVQLYNLIVLACTKLNNQRAALDVYKRWAPNPDFKHETLNPNFIK